MGTYRQKYKNILVTALRKIGDTVIATAGIHLLKTYYPQARVSALVTPLAQDILRNHPLVDEVIVYDFTARAKWAEIWSTVKYLKSKHFDVCIVLDGKPRAVVLAWLAGIPERIGFERVEFRTYYLKALYTRIIPIDYDPMQLRQVENLSIFIHRLTNAGGV